MAKRTKPCEWCKEQRYCVALFNPYHIVKDEYGRFVEERVRVPNNYCPNCGRKLGW
jgi:hypothetical protein